MLTPAILFKREVGPGCLAYYCESGVINFIDRSPSSPVVQDVIEQPKELVGIDVARCLVGRQASELSSDRGISVLLFPTGECAMKCAYCKSSGGGETLDPGKIRNFLGRSRFQSARVFGGEPLLSEDIINSVMGFAGDLSFSTGMGLVRGAFESTISRMLDARRVDFTLSIDPPPSGGKEYTRNFPGHEGDWYSESIHRAGWIARQLESRGYDTSGLRVKAIISRHCYNYRKLVEDLRSAGVTGRVSLSAVNNAHGTDISPTQETYNMIVAQLELDTVDSLYGPDGMAPTLWDVSALIEPGSNFVTDGCYDLFRRLHVSSNGDVGLCYCGDSKVGTVDELDLDAYSRQLLASFHPPNVANGRIWCPSSGAGSSKTILSHLLWLAAYRTIANFRNAESIRHLYEHRVRKMREWNDFPLPSSEDCRKLAEQWLGNSGRFQSTEGGE